MTTPPPTERSVQRAILAMAGVCFRDVFVTAIPNGAHLAGSDTARFKQMGALKGDGLKVGFPDLLCLWHPGKGCMVEVKRPKIGRLSDNQERVHERLRSLEWPLATVTSVDEAYAFLRQCGAPCSGELAIVDTRNGEPPRR
jgi:hypothetical protein